MVELILITDGDKSAMDGLTSDAKDIQVSTAASHFHYPDFQWNEIFDSSYCKDFGICSTDICCDCKYDREHTHCMCVCGCGCVCM